ncbi:hypothetical protein THTE_3076 [Thermogutta terrifontis]|uniref:Uncharacterized protein n=1 Tax=Thermogutta terrifontis TaxID=1331910 RepID=A0A286RI96_9BACT|nr:hypothetical protein THTE_3076 [Thermogutta terrifontis]
MSKAILFHSYENCGLTPELLRNTVEKWYNGRRCSEDCRA